MAERFRIADTCPWPQRRGLECTIVQPTPEQAKVYPFAGLGKNEVVIHIPDDPLWIDSAYDPWWNCVLNRKHLIGD